jgi:hypothetical protein
MESVWWWVMVPARKFFISLILMNCFFFASKIPLLATDVQVFFTHPSSSATPPYTFATVLYSLMADNLM